MSAWKQIRLELASTRDFPLGSVARAYLLRLPLADDDHVDVAAYRRSPALAVVHRHWSTEPDQSGQLFEVGVDWIIRSEGNPESRLELDGKALRLGQHIPLKLSEGNVVPLRIASIR